MLLLDKTKKPENTVYYLSALSYGFLQEHEGLDFSEFCDALGQHIGHKANEVFLGLAVDFLFLLNKISVDEKGGLHVH